VSSSARSPRGPGAGRRIIRGGPAAVQRTRRAACTGPAHPPWPARRHRPTACVRRRAVALRGRRAGGRWPACGRPCCS
jgi:hypothetical protein